MRITMLTRAGRGNLSGGFKVTTQYAEALTRAGHEVVMVSPKKEAPLFPGPIGRRLPFRKAAARRTDFVENRSYDLRILDRDRPVEAADVPDADVVVASWYEAVLWMADLPPEKGVKVHFAQGYELADHASNAAIRRAFDLDIARIAVSGTVAESLRANHGARAVSVVANGVDTARFAPGPLSRPPTFGVLYTERKGKRIGLAVDALRLAGADALGFGMSPPRDAHGDAFAAYRTAPAQDDIPGLYGACRAWLFPTAHEGFGLPILEAMACGTPVIATRAGAAPDLIDGTNGVLVDGTPEAMAAEIRRFAAMSADEWRRTSEAARATAEANTLAAAARRFEAALAEIAAR